MFGERMKVALIHIRYIYKGGLETRLFSYIDYFINRGDEVHLFTSKISPDISPPANLHIHHLNLKRIPKPIRNFFFDKKLKQIIGLNEFDFILALERTSRQNHVIAPSTHKGYLQAKGAKFSTIVDLVQLYLDRKAFNNAKVIYACSKMVKDEIINLYRIAPNKVRVLHPPIRLSMFETSTRDVSIRERNGWSKEDKIFLLVSTSHKRKGLDTLIAVFKELPKNYKLLVAGTSFKSSNPQIVSLGFVKDMGAIYHQVDVLLHPAVYEPFGQIITEAFAAKVPVIISDRVGAKEFVNSNRGLVLDSLAPAVWCEAILKFDKEKISFEDIEEVLKELSLESHMEKMLNWAIFNK